MQEVARGQPNGLVAFDNGADNVGGQEGIADCLAHAVRWDGVFGGNLLIGFACFDSVEPGEGVGDIAQECAVDGFRGVAQNELGLDKRLLTGLRIYSTRTCPRRTCSTWPDAPTPGPHRSMTGVDGTSLANIVERVSI